MSGRFWANTVSLPKHYQRPFLSVYCHWANVRNEDDRDFSSGGKAGTRKNIDSKV